MIIQDISAYKLVVYDDSGNTWFRHVGFFCSYSQTETDFSIGARALNTKLIVQCGGGPLEVVDVVYIALAHQFMKFYTNIINFKNIYTCPNYINAYYAR